MYFNICNDVSVRNYNLKGKNPILIRVLEPSYKISGIPYEIDNIDQYIDVLELYIKDTISVSEIISGENVFNYEKSKILNDFILKNDFDEVVVHCSLGISRSPAIMICIAKIIESNELETLIKEKYRFYNSYIVNIFESFNYSFKKVEINNGIEGNILSKKSLESDDYVLKKMIKRKDFNSL